jgi:hypothetical protein
MRERRVEGCGGAIELGARLILCRDASPGSFAPPMRGIVIYMITMTPASARKSSQRSSAAKPTYAEAGPAVGSGSGRIWMRQLTGSMRRCRGVLPGEVARKRRRGEVKRLCPALQQDKRKGSFSHSGT